jgi:hypothetical protein
MRMDQIRNIRLGAMINNGHPIEDLPKKKIFVNTLPENRCPAPFTSSKEQTTPKENI